jgi:murein peptide amidase A
VTRLAVAQVVRHTKMNFSIFTLFLLVIISCTPMRKSTTQNASQKVKQIHITNSAAPPLLITAYPTLTKPNTQALLDYCEKIDNKFNQYNWGKSQCADYSWNHVRNSVKGDPLIWFVFGDEQISNVHEKTTLIFCAVHGDEIVPVKFCFDILNDLKANPQLFDNRLVIIAPIVNPDSFLIPKPTRTNANKVDINRNFPTKDWAADALRLWKTKYRSDPRRYPGKYALSEPETLFQVNLILRYKPSKIISVHSPLTMIDYDGPSFHVDIGKNAKDLLHTMSSSAQSYKISNYPFFPGSLGNWAGNERNIPTYTLEMPNSDWNKTNQYYKMFQKAIHEAIRYNLYDLKDSPLTQDTD